MADSPSPKPPARRLDRASLERVLARASELQAGSGETPDEFTEEQLLANVKAMIDALNRAKPSGAKGVYIKKISLSSTMGPGFKIDTASFGAAEAH